MGHEMMALKSVEAQAGKGLKGDRYNLDISKGAFSEKKSIPIENRMLSLISTEGIEAANKEVEAAGGIPYTVHQIRRNLVINMKSEDMNQLIGKKILIGEVVIEITNLCNPCARPASLLNRNNDFEVAFTNRGGLRGVIISSGIIRIGMELKVLNTDSWQNKISGGDVSWR